MLECFQLIVRQFLPPVASNEASALMYTGVIRKAVNVFSFPRSVFSLVILLFYNIGNL